MNRNSKEKDQQVSFLRLSNTERIIVLFTGDLLASILSLFAALYIWAHLDSWLIFSLEFLTSRTPSWFYLIHFVWSLLIIELYDIRKAANKKATILAIILASGIGFILYLIIYFTVGSTNPLPRISVAIFIPIVSILTLLWRLIYIKLFTTPIFMRRVLIVGAGNAGRAISDVIINIHPEPFKLVGLLDDDPNKIGEIIQGIRVLGNRDDLLDIIRENGITDIICAITYDIQDELLTLLLKAEETGTQITTMPIMYEELLGRVPIAYLDNDWLLKTFFDQAHSSESYTIFKRFFDIIISLIGLIPFILTFPFLALVIKLDSKGTVLIKQERIGRNGNPYILIKYRTMINDSSNGELKPTMKNDSRITRVGHILRKTHLDELPQVLQILRGKMSVVGPRSEITQFVNKFEKNVPFYRARLLAKPGLTGWAQIHQSYAATIKETSEKLEYDLYYIKHRSFLFDIHIMARTIGQVLGFRGR